MTPQPVKTLFLSSVLSVNSLVLLKGFLKRRLTRVPNLALYVASWPYREKMTPSGVPIRQSGPQDKVTQKPDSIVLSLGLFTLFSWS